MHDRKLEEQTINPKDRDAKAQRRIKFHTIPPIVKVLLARAMTEGAYDKGYGVMNWRKLYPIEADVYTDAAERHLTALQDGEWVDRDSGLPHAVKLIACMTIMLDAFYEGTMDHSFYDERVKTAANMIWDESHKND